MSYAVNVSEMDLRDYTGPARVSARSAQHVARGLEAAIPIDATPEERAALSRAVAAADDVAACLLEREQTAAGRVRPAFLAFGTAWSVLGDGLTNLARLPAEVSPRGPRAAAMFADVLPEGTSFTQLESGQAWGAAQRRLQHIDAEGLGPALAELVGADVLEAARRATATLREVSGAGPAATDVASTRAVGDKLAVFSRLVGIYCRLLAAKVDEASAETVERFRRAVTPLEQYRASRRSAGEDDDAPPVVVDPTARPGMPGSSPFITGPTA